MLTGTFWQKNIEILYPLQDLSGYLALILLEEFQHPPNHSQ